MSTPPPTHRHTHTLQHPSHAMFVVTNKHDTRVICIHAQHAHKQIQMDLPGRDDGSTDSARVRMPWISGLHRSWRRGACSLGEVSGKVGVLVDRQGRVSNLSLSNGLRPFRYKPLATPRVNKKREDTQTYRLRHIHHVAFYACRKDPQCVQGIVWSGERQNHHNRRRIFHWRVVCSENYC